MTMTPEERAVINAAIEDSRTLGGIFDTSPLRKAVNALIFACPKCNAGGHTCPGDGNPIGHADSDCGEHDDDGPREDPLSGELISATQDAELDRWGREMAAEGRRLELLVLQANALHHESQTEVSAGRSALSIDGVSTGAVLRERVTALANYHGSTTHLLADIDQELDEAAEWVPRTWVDVRAGDRVRLPGTEHVAEVESVVALPWHVHPAADSYRPNEKPAEWTEIKVRLVGRPGLLSMSPGGPIEIELTASELAAIEALGWPNRVRMEING